MPLNPDSRQPPYLQISADLVAAIKDGTYPPGARLPSQKELTAEYGVSRSTAVNALKHVVHHGYAVSRQGIGAFVLTKPIPDVSDVDPGELISRHRAELAGLAEERRTELRRLAAAIEADQSYRPMASVEVVRAVVARIRELADRSDLT